MKLQADAIITQEKITDYLLKWRPDNDKSQFLKQAGYTQDNWQHLLEDIRNQILPLEAEFLQTRLMGDYGRFEAQSKAQRCYHPRCHHLDAREIHGDDKVHHSFP